MLNRFAVPTVGFECTSLMRSNIIGTVTYVYLSIKFEFDDKSLHTKNNPESSLSVDQYFICYLVPIKVIISFPTSKMVELITVFKIRLN